MVGDTDALARAVELKASFLDAVDPCPNIAFLPITVPWLHMQGTLPST